MNIDLHLHTNNSDGDDSTKEIIQKAKDLDISLISITDHDTVNAYDDLKDIDTMGIKIIPAVELSCAYESEMRDILGYNIDIEKMRKILKSLESKEEDIKREKELLTEYIDVFRKNGIIVDDGLKIEDGEKNEGYKRTIISALGHEENIKKYPSLMNPSAFFWDNCANKKSSFYVDESRFFKTIKQTIDIIHEADGMAFFAHPCIHHMEHDRVEKMLDYARSFGLDGVEVLHAKHSIKDREFLIDYANKHNIYKSGGSDYHGSPKPDIKILTGRGDLNVSYDLIENWVSKII
ncbi:MULTISPECIES: PHP domain-containing protein [Anaerofustis]|uniref:PHP domain-containing protein n=1 Tax=Anaerofustis TaxID=264995 RepID=UPI001106C592|nr:MULTISPECIES: PHP domain-containing protein [Anaerofustis]MCO8193762.1 PHP domain-containing protein [Anaerofustis sp. NSJ-163]